MCIWDKTEICRFVHIIIILIIHNIIWFHSCTAKVIHFSMADPGWGIWGKCPPPPLSP